MRKPGPTTRGRFLRGLALLLSAIAAGCGQAPKPSMRPGRNVLLVVVDTLRYDAGGGRPADAEAAIPESLRTRGRHFLQALSAGIHTKPSMMALLTGFYASESGLVVNGAKVLNPPGPMLAERLPQSRFRDGRRDQQSESRRPGARLRPWLRLLRRADDRSRAQPADRDTQRLRDDRCRARGADRSFPPVQTLVSLGALPRAARSVPAAAGFPRDPRGSRARRFPWPKATSRERERFPATSFCRSAVAATTTSHVIGGTLRTPLSEAERLLSAVYASPSLRDTIVIFTADHGEFLGEQDYWFQHGIRIDPVAFSRSPRRRGVAGRTEERGASLRRAPRSRRVASAPAPPAGRVDARRGSLRPRPRNGASRCWSRTWPLPGTRRNGSARAENPSFVESNREPPTEFVAGPSVWSARRPYGGGSPAERPSDPEARAGAYPEHAVPRPTR